VETAPKRCRGGETGISSLISYAQNFEDVMLARVFAGRNTGFYVDVGAADPVNLSVTKWFYDLGWSGLNIEPNKQLFDRLAADRPRDINLDCGVGATASEAQFFEVDVGELSSFDSRVRDNALLNGKPPSTRTVTVMPLTDLLNLHCPDRTIHFLKIDVEGWEAEVLKGLDLKRYRPIVILIEATVPQTRVESHKEWEPAVLGADYSFVYFDGVNRFYLANEHADLKKHFATPPNVFDDFETFPLVRARTDAEQRLEAMHKLSNRNIWKLIAMKCLAWLRANKR
jgi:FkbM family methyltransferase